MKKTIYLLLLTVMPSFVYAESITVNRQGKISAESFFDASYFMINRSLAEQTDGKISYSGNKFGEEFQPQEGQNKIGENQSFYWDIDTASICSLNSEGVRTVQRSVVCKKFDGTSGTSTIIANQMCNPDSKLPESIYCIDENSTYQWLVKNNGQCSTRCGTGTVPRIISCLKIDNTTKAHEIVVDNECILSGLIKPSAIGECSATAGCTKEWKYTNFGECQGSCGTEGIKTREASCRDNQDNLIDNLECEAMFGPPVTTEPCVPECADWVFSEWSECQGNCFESGITSREAECKNTKGDIVNDERCPALRETLEVSKSCIKQCQGSSCFDLYSRYPELQNGVYTLTGPNGDFSATCDMANGGWTLVPNLGFLANLNQVTTVSGYTEEQSTRLLTLVRGGMSNWINYSHTWSPGQLDGSNPSTSYNIYVNSIVTFSKDNNILMPISTRVNGWSWADDNDAGRIYLSLYNIAGTNLYNYDSGYNNWSSGWTAWYNFYYTNSPVPNALDSDLGRIRYYFYCSRKSGVKCSAQIVAYTYINADLPKTNFWVK